MSRINIPLAIFLAFTILAVMFASAASVDGATFAEAGTGATIEEGKGTFTAAGTSAQLSLVIDGADFIPVVTKNADTAEVVFTSGEKDFMLFDNPAISETFKYSDGKLEESVTIKEKRAISYRITLPDKAYLVRLDDGRYRVTDPAVDDRIEGFIVINKAWGTDANGERVTFDYVQTTPGVLTLVYPEKDLTDNGKPITYPLYVDPLLEQKFDLKLLLHFNTAEDGNTSLFNFVDSSRNLAPMFRATSNVSINTSAIAGGKFGNGSFRSTGVAADFVRNRDTNTAFNLSNQNFALNLWFNSTGAIGVNKSLMFGGNPASGAYAWEVYLPNSTSIAFGATATTTGGAPYRAVCRVGAISTGRWHQLTIIRNSSSALDMYQNGTFICSNTPPTKVNMPDNYHYVQIPTGQYAEYGISMTPLTGFIDEASVWVGGAGREIADFPAEEFGMFVNATYPPISGGYADDDYTVSLLHFNDIDGGKNMTDQTGKVWTPHGGAAIETNESKFDGSSLFLNGSTGSYLDTNRYQDFNFGSEAWTIDFWMNNTPTGANSGIFTTKNSSAGGLGYLLFRQTSTGKIILQSNDGPGLAQDIATNPLPNNTWMHIAVVNDGTTLNTYVNGQLNTTAPIRAQFLSDNGAVVIGSPYTNSFSSTAIYYGWIDEFRVTRGYPRWMGNFTVPYYPYELTNASFTHSDPIDDQTWPVTVVFNDTSPDSDWTQNTYYTTFGDGLGNVSLIRSFNHNYWSNGTFTVGMQVYNNNMTDTETDSITIGIPNTDFTASPRSGTAALLVQFTDNTQNLTPITSWNWSFGDGGYSDDQNPQHVYAAFGVYDVNLTVVCADGSNSELKSDYIITSTDQNNPDRPLFAHEVRMQFVDLHGDPIENLPVSAVMVNSSIDGTNWFTTLFGIQSDTTPFNGTVLSSITDSYGSVVFPMIGSGLYEVRAIDASRGISHIKLLHPQESEYLFIVSSTASTRVVAMSELVSTNLSTAAIGGNVYLNITYNDTGKNTTNVRYFIQFANKSFFYQKNFPGTPTLNQSVEFGYPVANTKGAGYVWGFAATNSRWGNITQSNGVTMKGIDGMLWNPFVLKDGWE